MSKSDQNSQFYECLAPAPLEFPKLTFNLNSALDIILICNTFFEFCKGMNVSKNDQNDQVYECLALELPKLTFNLNSTLDIILILKIVVF